MHPQMLRRDLRRVEEIRAQKPQWEEAHVQEEEKHRRPPCRGGRDVRHGDRETDHGHAHAEPRHHEQRLAAEAVDRQERERRRDDLPGQHPGRKQRGAVAAKAERLAEDGGRVVRDDVGARHLRVEVDQKGQHGPVEETLGAHREERLEAGFVLLLGLAGVSDRVELSREGIIVYCAIFQDRQHLSSLLHPLLLNEPARRLWEAECGDHEDSGENEWNCQGQAPADGAVLDERQAVVDPRRCGDARRDERTQHDDVLPPTPRL